MRLGLIYRTSQKIRASYYAVVYTTECCFGKWSVRAGSTLRILFTQSCGEQRCLTAQTGSSLIPSAYRCQIRCSTWMLSSVFCFVCLKSCLFTCSCHAACWSRWSGPLTLSPTCLWKENFPAAGSRAWMSDSEPAMRRKKNTDIRNKKKLRYYATSHSSPVPEK